MTFREWINERSWRSTGATTMLTLQRAESTTHEIFHDLPLQHANSRKTWRTVRHQDHRAKHLRSHLNRWNQAVKLPLHWGHRVAPRWGVNWCLHLWSRSWNQWKPWSLTTRVFHGWLSITCWIRCQTCQSCTCLSTTTPEWTSPIPTPTSIDSIFLEILTWRTGRKLATWWPPSHPSKVWLWLTAASPWSRRHWKTSFLWSSRWT